MKNSTSPNLISAEQFRRQTTVKFDGISSKSSTPANQSHKDGKSEVMQLSQTKIAEEAKIKSSQALMDEGVYSFENVDKALIRYTEMMEKAEEAKRMELYIQARQSQVEELAAEEEEDEGSGLIEDLSLQQEEEPLEIGLFHLLKCDIKASDDMIKSKYLEVTQELIGNHLAKLKAQYVSDRQKEYALHSHSQAGGEDNVGEDDQIESERDFGLEFMESEQTINLNERQDLDLLKKLHEVVKAYQILSVTSKREEYIKTIRLRSFASQYMNTYAAERDGHIYPFLLFSVQEHGQGGSNEASKGRMIELNFVEDVLIDRRKDHDVNSYHISMVEKVIKGFKYDEFIIEFQNDDKPLSYFATFPLQRDFIVDMINFAVIKQKKATQSNRGINCPDNHNIKRKTNGPDVDKYLQSELKLEFILEDFVLPPKSIMIGACQKRNATLGYVQRFLMLGHSQLLIARDPEFNKIVSVVPLEGGFCMVQKPRDYGGLVIESTFRRYKLKFKTSALLVEWYKKVQQVASKEVKLKKYFKRVKIQEQMLQQEDFAFRYKSTLNQIDNKLQDLKKMFHRKANIEHKHKKYLDLEEKELVQKIQQVNQKAQQILNSNFNLEPKQNENAEKKSKSQKKAKEQEQKEPIAPEEPINSQEQEMVQVGNVWVSQDNMQQVELYKERQDIKMATVQYNKENVPKEGQEPKKMYYLEDFIL